MKNRLVLLPVVLFFLILFCAGCSETGISSAPTDEASTSTAVLLPTETATAIPTATSEPLEDLGSALISPADSIDFLMDYTYADTWVDDTGMHAGVESFYQDGPGARITLDCAQTPYKEGDRGIPDMVEITPEIIFGDETYIFVHRNKAYMVILLDNCRAEVALAMPYELDGELDENVCGQLEGMGSLIEARLAKVAPIDEGLILPASTKVNTELFDETFYSVVVWHWGEPHRSYTVVFDTKRPFIKETTLGLFDTDLQEFVFKRVVPNSPPMGVSEVSNLGEAIGWGEPVNAGDTYKTMDWDANYELYIWIEDELVGIFPLEKYDPPVR